MDMTPRFEVEFLPQAVDFLDRLDAKAREKIYYNIRKAQLIDDPELFKKLTDFIWEFRTLYNTNAYRMFAFKDPTASSPKLVVATHGLVKKTQKTPAKEIDRATAIGRQYITHKKQP